MRASACTGALHVRMRACVSVLTKTCPLRPCSAHACHTQGARTHMSRLSSWSETPGQRKHICVHVPAAYLMLRWHVRGNRALSLWPCLAQSCLEAHTVSPALP